MRKLFRVGVIFFVELIYLIWQINKSIIWTIFYFIFPPTEKYVRNEIALITGSAKGLGRQLAIEFAKRGSTIVLLDFDDDENSETVELVKKLTNLPVKRIYKYHCDLTSREEISCTSARIKQEVGDVTIIINNAGIFNLKSFTECREDEFMNVMRVNLFANYWILKEFLPGMLNRNHGHIVSVLSTASLFGLCHMSDYSTSKFAIIGMMESLDHELALAGYDGVVTTIVYPTPINNTIYAKSRELFNYFINPLTTQYAAKEILRAILINQKVVCIPRILYFLPIIKSLLPTTAFIACTNFVLQPSRPNLEVHNSVT